MMERVRRECIGNAEDRLDEMEGLIDEVRNGAARNPRYIAEVRRLAHSLKGMGGTFGYPLISVVSHRLEDFLEDAPILDISLVDDTQIFLDRMRDVIDGALDPDDVNTADIVRALPAKRAAFELRSVKVLDIEVMTIMANTKLH